jgi:hypothetical protein
MGNINKTEKSGDILSVNFSGLNKTRIVENLVLPDIPYIYVDCHRPSDGLEWWQSVVPINKDGKSTGCMIRNLQYEILFETRMFIQHMDDIISNGFALYQSFKVIPPSFRPDNIKTNFYQVAKNVGIISSIVQPSANDIICFGTSNPILYSDILARKEIADLIL